MAQATRPRRMVGTSLKMKFDLQRTASYTWKDLQISTTWAAIPNDAEVVLVYEPVYQY